MQHQKCPKCGFRFNFRRDDCRLTHRAKPFPCLICGDLICRECLQEHLNTALPSHGQELIKTEDF
jgi:hypothetical protein